MSVPDPSSWVVHKFGGSSVAEAGCLSRVAAIVESHPAQGLAVVLSACRGVPDSLLRLVARAERQDESWRQELLARRERHGSTAATLPPAATVAEYLEEFA